MAKKMKRQLSFPPLRADQITIQNGKRLIMEGVERIIFCDPEKMILQGDRTVQILGEGLSLLELGNNNMEVSGVLHTVTFLEKKA